MILKWQLSVIQLTIIAICGAIICGCASRGIQTPTGEQATNIIEVFESGEARLNCEVLCSGAWGSSRKQAKKLYEQGLWTDLAVKVAGVGFKADQTYFYLGRAAEGLGYSDSARTYYQLGLASSFKCAGVLNNCDGLVLPDEILAGINRLPALAKAGKPTVISPSNAAVQKKNTTAIKNDQAYPLSEEKNESPKVDKKTIDSASDDRLKKTEAYEGRGVTAESNISLTVFGIPLSSYPNMEQCWMKMAKESGNMCYYKEEYLENTIRITFPVIKFPQILCYNDISATLINGKIESLTISTCGVDRSQLVMSDLKEKFGKPVVSEDHVYTNRLGAKFIGQDATWITREYFVDYYSVGPGNEGNADRGVLYIDTKAGRENRVNTIRSFQEKKQRL